MQLDASAGILRAIGASDDATRGTRVGTLRRSMHERDRHEAALRESERLFRTMFERAVVGMAHVAPDGRWLRVNQRLCDILGYTRQELTARSFQDLTHPDDLAACLATQQRLLAGERDADEWDKRYIRKDGAVVWVHLTVSLVRTPEGAPDYFIAMVQDITEHKRLEVERARLLEWERATRRELEATNAQLRALQALTDTALSHLALDDLLGELLSRMIGVMAMDQVGILLLDEDGRTLTLRAARGLLDAAPDWDRFAMGQGLPGRIAASRAPLIVDAPSAVDFDGAPPLLRERLHSAAGVPLLMEDPVAAGHLASRLVGVLVVGRATPHRFTEADVQLLQRAADRVALAIDRARLFAAEQDARRRAEAALARAQASEAEATERAERLYTILETMADGVAVYDAAGHPVQMVNRAYRELFALERGPAEYEALTTFERARLVQVGDAVSGAPLPFEENPVGRALRGEVVTGPSADVRARAFDGRELELNASAAPLREPDGRVTGVVVVLRDLTEHKRLARERQAARADELAAREASRRLEEFLATAAHDLRTPLSTTLGYLDLATRQTTRLVHAAQQEYPALAQQVAAVRARLEDADQSTERLSRLLTRLFDTMAIRSGKLEMHRVPCDLAALLREQVAGLRIAAPERTIRLHLPAADEPIPVEADADRLGQVVANYVTNGLKYSPADRPVDVAVTAHGGRARVTVCDQGPGIPKEEQARVWELFHRAPGVTTPGWTPGGTSGRTPDNAQGGSLGLGLHISKDIVKAHGGQVGVKSTVGEGSTFWFTLPLSFHMTRQETAPS